MTIRFLFITIYHCNQSSSDFPPLSLFLHLRKATRVQFSQPTETESDVSFATRIQPGQLALTCSLTRLYTGG